MISLVWVAPPLLFTFFVLPEWYFLNADLVISLSLFIILQWLLVAFSFEYILLGMSLKALPLQLHFLLLSAAFLVYQNIISQISHAISCVTALNMSGRPFSPLSAMLGKFHILLSQIKYLFHKA